MTEHVHEWRRLGSHPVNGHINAMCENPSCWENLSTQDILRRLNATEKLSMEDARVLGDSFRIPTPKEAARAVGAASAYAAALSGDGDD